MLEIRPADRDDAAFVAPLVARFRAALARFRHAEAMEDVAAAREEFFEYLEKGSPVYLALEGGECAGYLVCRIDAPCVWVESLYVEEAHRRRGVTSRLYGEAEELARGYGESTLYNYVHPNNDPMIAFLARRGYDVLNLIEIRKPYPDEEIQSRIPVGEHSFKY